MKIAIIVKIFVFAAALLLLAGCSGRLGPHEVLAIKKTNTYHREGCPPTNMARTTIMTAAEARTEKFKPCPVCKPETE
jgi:uncharacterized lipoprotein YajG